MDIYKQHQEAFSRVSAFVIVKDGERVATVALKYPADGAGRLYAYVHWIGLPMVRGFAAGGGYDKATAACAAAVGKMWGGSRWCAPVDSPREIENVTAFLNALSEDRGPRWDDALRSAGFTVWSAV